MKVGVKVPGLPESENRMIQRLFVLTHYQHVTTDGQTDTSLICVHVCRASIAERDKNYSLLKILKLYIIRLYAYTRNRSATKESTIAINRDKCVQNRPY